MTKFVVVSYDKPDGRKIIGVRRASGQHSDQEEAAALLNEVISSTSTINGTKASFSSSSVRQQRQSLKEGKTRKDSAKTASRVRATTQMTNFMVAQGEKYNLFDCSLFGIDKELNRRTWIAAREEFNDTFNTNIDMTAYKRKFSHLKKVLAKDFSQTGEQSGHDAEQNDDGTATHATYSKRIQISQQYLGNNGDEEEAVVTEEDEDDE